MSSVSSYPVLEETSGWTEEALSTPLSLLNWEPKYRLVKRGLDLLIALPASIGLAPLLIFCGIFVKLTSPGPAFYAWNVVGRGGKPFRGYKFRTMVQNSDRLKSQLLDRNEMSGPVFKIKDDPRITLAGKFLRKFSLDELPQIWSVIKGDMSLVGPRPVLADEWGEFSDWQRQKLAIKPGAVSLWHVKGHPNDLDEWVKLDLEYIQNWSLKLDLKILWFAAAYILSGKNC